MNVVLIGMKHCGKSTIGAALAGRWGCRLHDVDPMIEATHACDTDERITVREILARHGEDYFRRVEGHVVCELYLKLDQPDSTAVVALGGRTALNRSICELLGAIGLIVYLQVSPEEAYARIERAGLPPFLDEGNPATDFFELYREREPHYRRLADRTLNVEGLTPEGAVDRLIHSIEEHTHARK